MNKGPLVRVQIGPKRFVKMYTRDAENAGYIKKSAPVAENKMLTLEDKGAEARDDFTTIQGIGLATQKLLYANGCYTFDQLKECDLSYLSKAQQDAIEAWRLS